MSRDLQFITFDGINTMEFGILFAFKALAGVLGFALGLLLGSLASALWLRVAAAWLGFGNVSYKTAFKCAIISNFTVAVIQFAIGFNYGLVTQLITENSRPLSEMTYAFPPIYFLYTLIVGLVVTAAIFRPIIKNGEDSAPVPFSDAFALASLYCALTFAIMIVLAAILVLLLSGVFLLFYGP